MARRKKTLTDDEISLWHQRIAAAEEFLEDNILPHWRKVFLDYEGNYRDQNTDPYAEDDVPSINYLLATANTIVPSVVSADPYVRCLPRRPGDEEGAKIAENALNYVFREVDLKSVLNDVVLDSILFNCGFAKVGYDPSGAFLMEEEYEVGPEKLDEEDESVLSIDAQMRLRQALADEDIPFDEGPQDNPTIERVAPWDILVPPGYEDIQKCPWVCQRMTVRVQDLEADERFKIPKGLEPDSWLTSETPSAFNYKQEDYMGFDDDDRPEYLTVYEIRHWGKTRLGGRRRCLWLIRPQEGISLSDCVIRHIDDPLEMRGYPYQMLRFTKVPGVFYSPKVADLAAIHGLADQLNKEWQHLIRHHKMTSKRKWVGLPGILEDGSLQNLLESDYDMEVAELPANVGDIRNALMLLPEAPPPSTTPMVLQGLARLMYEISGVDVYQRGGVGRKGTTATEVAVAAQGASNRAGVRLGATERFTEKIARQVLSVIRQYWDDPRYMRITGVSGEPEFVMFSAADIIGMFDVRIESGSTLGKDPGTEQQAFMGLLQTIQATVSSLIPLVQAGIAPPQTIQSFVEKAFSIWQADKRMLMEPLAALQGAATPQTSQPSPGGMTPPGGLEGRGMGAEGQPLAGPRPMEERTPGGASSGTGGAADLATLMARVRGS
tara:strand:+ start:1945 stop:3933 length:1989 start_codon:yes stop_codon:yes gene_type:complete